MPLVGAVAMLCTFSLPLPVSLANTSILVAVGAPLTRRALLSGLAVVGRM